MIESVLSDHKRILLDSCIWIYHIEDHPDYSDLTQTVLNHVAIGSCHAVISELSLLEIKIHPLRKGREDIANEYELLLDHFPNLSIVPIDREILHQACFLRAHYGFKTPDSIILATGIKSSVTLAVSNDRKWKNLKILKTLCLSDYC